MDARILEPWILKVLPLGNFSNLNVATIKQNGISDRLFQTEARLNYFFFVNISANCIYRNNYFFINSIKFEVVNFQSHSLTKLINLLSPLLYNLKAKY